MFRYKKKKNSTPGKNNSIMDLAVSPPPPTHVRYQQPHQAIDRLARAAVTWLIMAPLQSNTTRPPRAEVFFSIASGLA